jgi:DNA-binding transcriptional ArsR family regulator
LLNTLITSRTRIRLLLKFFSNSRTTDYLRAMADEFGESTNSVRTELKRLQEAGLITSESNGNKLYYRANRDHALYPELKGMARKTLGLHQIERMVERLGNVKLAMVTGDYARGQDTGIIDLVIVGSVDQIYLNLLVKKAEDLILRKIRTLLITPEEYPGFRERFTKEKALILWEDGG